MGSFDGAEICELVGIYILHNLFEITEKENVGLYRDDGLLILRNHTKRMADINRKKVIKVFKDIGFDIEIVTNLKTVDFLDITLDLSTGSFRPYKKPNDQLQYVHTSSNHPRNILDQLPTSINNRLSRNSSNTHLFNQAKVEYEQALINSGYKNQKLTYAEIPEKKESRSRKRNVIWFNPPFNKSVSTNVAKSFLKLIDKHFTKDNDLYKVFNRNNVKVSYSCTQNVKSIINSHNKKVSAKKNVEKLECNCRKKNECPLNGDCRTSSIVYKCNITAPNHPNKVYIGLTAQEFKDRLQGHNTTFKHEKYRHSTSLSNYVWSLKDNGITPSLKWSIMKHAPAYTNTTKSCSLCLQKKLEILRYPNKKELLNKRSEILNKSRHLNRFLLANYKSKD